MSQDELDQIRAKIQDHLISSGNYELINKQLKLKLYENGWYDKVGQLATTELQQEDNKNLTFERLYAMVKPQAELMVPDEVRQEIMTRIREYLEDVIQKKKKKIGILVMIRRPNDSKSNDSRNEE